MKIILFFVFLILSIFLFTGCDSDNNDNPSDNRICETAGDCSKDEFCNNGYCKPDACANAFCGTHSTDCARLSETDYECICDKGYFENENHKCVTPCKADSCDEGVLCNPKSATEFECGCKDGYQDNDNNGTCEKSCDENSCKGEHKTKCDDSGGVIICNCDDNYFAEGDNCVSPCNEDSCSGLNMGVCKALDSDNYECLCKDGYFKNNNGNCESPCDSNPCFGNHVTGCQATTATDFSCVCEADSYENGNHKCINPCDSINCGAGGTCVVLGENDVQCHCNDGYHLDSEINTCVENNLCEGINCGDRGHCEVENQQAVCKCDDGFYADAYVCVDINECDTNPCDINAVCENTSGSYSCRCKPGFIGNGISCSDINECDSNPCDVNAVCENTGGSYKCTCNAGYSGDGVTCNDINECELNTDNCSVNQYCKNNLGGFSCESCNCNSDNENTVDNTCSDETGACNCALGYTGTNCDECADGYREYNDNCYLTCETTTLVCGNGSYCDDSEGEPVCVATWSVVRGGKHSYCGITNGKLYCWGREQTQYYNFYKTYGFSSETEWENHEECVLRSQYGHDYISCSPVQIGSDSDWKDVENNLEYVCALKTSGELYCWGKNNNLSINSYVPRKVDDNLWSKISVYDDIICGIRNNGELYCWGNNEAGRLGTGDTINYIGPHKIGENSDWTDISVSYSHICGVRNNGNLYCWGSSESGQLGLGDEDTLNNLDGCDYDSCITPQLVGNFTDVVAGDRYTCAKNINNELYCWGNNEFGQLGIENYEEFLWSPVSVSGDNSNWGKFDLDGSACALKLQNLYCWGDRDEHTPPVYVDTGMFWNSISVSGATCGITEDNRLYCWDGLYYDIGFTTSCNSDNDYCPEPREVKLKVE